MIVIKGIDDFFLNCYQSIQNWTCASQVQTLSWQSRFGYVEHNLKKPVCTHTDAAGCHHCGNWCQAPSERNSRCKRGAGSEKRQGGPAANPVCALPCQHGHSMEANMAKIRVLRFLWYEVYLAVFLNDLQDYEWISVREHLLSLAFWSQWLLLIKYTSYNSLIK